MTFLTKFKPNGMKKEGVFSMVKLSRFETFCLQTGVKTLVSETGQQLPPSIDLQNKLTFGEGGSYIKWSF